MTIKTDNPREAAALAVLHYLRRGTLISKTLGTWFADRQPPVRDRAFAQELSSGTVRKLLTLEATAKQLSSSGKLRLSPEAKALLFTGLYQLTCMDAVPAHAAVDETVALSKKLCHASQGKFLNALLRRAVSNPVKLPDGDDAQALSTRHSFPLAFVNTLVDSYGLEKAVTALEASNLPPTAMARVRHDAAAHTIGATPITDTLLPMLEVSNRDLLLKAAENPGLYIQNATPVQLMASLSKGISTPKTILDLCASPGGKTVLAHDLFPTASIVSNDVSEQKLRRLHENIQNYRIPASVTCCKGQDFPPPDIDVPETYDLIILDVPCSNSGTLNKRPEARWRLDDEHLLQLHSVQTQLLDKARQLLSPNGQIWYMTCSVLPQENETFIKQYASDMKLLIKQTIPTILPNRRGWDGGFAIALANSDNSL